VTLPGANSRDTDADWREIGRSLPYWGVLTQDRFRKANLGAEDIAAFYATGIQHMSAVAAAFAPFAGTPFHVDSALDFGCGTGRLAEAMLAYAGHVTGYDISPGMLAQARSRASRATYTNELPDGPFGWINSFIVFQHIPPARGMALLDKLLARLAPGGFISLHFTLYRDGAAENPDTGRLRHIPPGPRLLIRRALRRFRSNAPVGQVSMYDYDLTRIVEVLNRAGITRLSLVHDNHGGHHGAKIFGRMAP